jgi:hypothetical protein
VCLESRIKCILNLTHGTNAVLTLETAAQLNKGNGLIDIPNNSDIGREKYYIYTTKESIKPKSTNQLALS